MMPTLIRLTMSMKLSDIPTKKDAKYLLLMRGPITLVACADSLTELEGHLFEKKIEFNPANSALFEMPEDTDIEWVVDTLGNQLDHIFGMKGDRFRFRGPH